MALPFSSSLGSQVPGGLDRASSMGDSLPGAVMGTFDPATRLLVAALIFLAVGGLALSWVVRLRQAASFAPSGAAAAEILARMAGLLGLAVAAALALSYATADFMLLAILAFAAFIAALMAQSPIGADLLAGAALLLDRRLQVGDWVAHEAGEGRVKAIWARSTELETGGGGILVIPHRALLAKPVTRWRAPGEGLPLRIRFPIAQGADPERVLSLLERTASVVPGVSLEQPPVATLDECGPGGLEVSLRVIATEGAAAFKVASALRCEGLKTLRMAGIALAHPQRDIHLRDLDGLRQAFAAAIAERQRRQPPESKS
jgi:small-conductance mechanosensitive channel